MAHPVSNPVRADTVRAFFLRVVSSISALPSLRHEPGRFADWLLGALRANLVPVAICVTVGAVVAIAGDALLDRALASSSFTERIAGALGAKTRSERRRDVAGRLLHIAVWIGGTGFIAMRLVFHGPAVSQRSGPWRKRDIVSGRFALGERLGEGASGAVYRAEDTVLGRSVALKQLKLELADADAVERFRREAKVLARLNHPGIVQIYDFIEHRGHVWIAMELVEGGDLASLLGKTGRLSADDGAQLGERIAAAVAFAHSRQIVHRDLKPLNILLVDPATPKISDFGLARLTASTTNTVQGTILGTPLYMSPEQADGRPADARSDIYSLGCVLYEMFAGHPPFDGELPSVLMQHLRRTPPPLREAVDGIPGPLDSLVMQMLAKAPSDRPRNMESVSRALASHAAPCHTPR